MFKKYDRAVIKNFEKFKNVQMARGLSIRKFRSVPRIDGKVGVSTEAFGKYWYLLPKGNAIFKTYDGNFEKDVRDVRMFNELLCQELCQMMDVDCAIYEAAHYGSHDGLVTYNVMQSPDERIMSLKKFVDGGNFKPERNLKSILKYLETCVKNGYKIDKTKFTVSMFKMIVFDYLTFQTDRHLGNIHIIVNDKEKTIKASPLLDNEFAFGGLCLGYLIDEGGNMLFREFLDDYCAEVKQFGIFREYHDDERFIKDQCRQIHILCEKSPQLQTILDDMVKKYNVANAILSLQRKGHKISTEYMQYVILISEYAKDRITNLEFCNQEDVSDTLHYREIEDEDTEVISTRKQILAQEDKADKLDEKNFVL